MPVPEAIDRCWRYLALAGDIACPAYMTSLPSGELEVRSGVEDRWRRHFDAANAIIDDLGLILSARANISDDPGYSELASGERRDRDLLRRAARLSTASVSRARTVEPGAPTARTLLALGRLDEVEHYAFWGRDIADPLDVDAQIEGGSPLRAAPLQGRHEEAVTLARESVALVAGSEWLRPLAQSHMALAEALRGAGDEPGARAAAQDAQRFASARQDQATERTIAAFLRG